MKIIPIENKTKTRIIRHVVFGTNVEWAGRLNELPSYKSEAKYRNDVS